MATSEPGPDIAYSFVRGGPLYRLQRAVGLIPDDGLGIGRRVIVFVAITWLPSVVLAAIEGRAVGGTEEPLLQHFGVHARCLIAIPAFLFAEGLLESICFTTFPYFVSSGLVDAGIEPAFREELRRAERLRDSWGVPLIIVAIMGTWLAMNAHQSMHLDELSWAVTPVGGGHELSFAGWWYLAVGRPIFALLLLLWLWRLVIAVRLFKGISRLDLKLVPTHPDRAAGLGFLEFIPIGFAPVVFGISAVIAARFGHEIMYHDVHVVDLRGPLIGMMIILLALFLSPMGPFSARLRTLKKESLWKYGSLIGMHGRLVQRRWIAGEQIEDSTLLDAAELGCVADANAIYDAVKHMRPTPLRRTPVMALLLAGLLPLLAMAAIEVPIKKMLSTLLGALI